MAYIDIIVSNPGVIRGEFQSNSTLLFKVNDTLDDILNESGDEEESENVVQQVLDEIGINISGQVHNHN